MRFGCAAALLAAALLAACEEPASHATPARTNVADLLAQRGLRTVAETREILFGSGERRQLVDGWSVDEYDRTEDAAFVWAIAREATLTFEVLDVTDEQFLATLSAFPTPAPQQISVLVNGHEVHQFVAEPLYLEYRFVVPAAVLRRGTNRLTFRHDQLGDVSNDQRRFAAAYRSILIGPQCLPLRAFGPPVKPEVRQQKVGRGLAAPLEIVGPAALRRRVGIPADAVLQYRLSLPASARAAAVSTVRIGDGTSTKEIVTRVAVPWFRGGRAREVEVDLSPWSGKTVDLELEVAPDVCGAAVTNVIVDRATIAVGDAAKPSRGSGA